MSGGGSTTSEVSIPQWLEDASRENIAFGNQAANIGYTPYYGPDVAAFTPMQQAAFQNTGQAANAFGMAGGGMTGMEGMPQAQQYAGGVTGYSSAPMFEQSMEALQQNRPGQYDAINSMFMDPQTGQGGYMPPPPVETSPFASFGGFGGGGGDGSGGARARDLARGTYTQGQSFQGPNLNRDVGYSTGGYSSLRDVFDGGGAGNMSSKSFGDRVRERISGLLD